MELTFKELVMALENADTPEAKAQQEIVNNKRAERAEEFKEKMFRGMSKEVIAHYEAMERRLPSWKKGKERKDYLQSIENLFNQLETIFNRLFLPKEENPIPLLSTQDKVVVEVGRVHKSNVTFDLFPESIYCMVKLNEEASFGFILQLTQHRHDWGVNDPDLSNIEVELQMYLDYHDIPEVRVIYTNQGIQASIEWWTPSPDPREDDLLRFFRKELEPHLSLNEAMIEGDQKISGEGQIEITEEDFVRLFSNMAEVLKAMYF